MWPNMMSAREGGFEKIRQMQTRGGGGQKTRKFCRHELSMAPNISPYVCTCHPTLCTSLRLLNLTSLHPPFRPLFNSPNPSGLYHVSVSIFFITSAFPHRFLQTKYYPCCVANLNPFPPSGLFCVSMGNSPKMRYALRTASNTGSCK